MGILHTLSLVPRVYSHSLIEMTYMLYWVHSTIVHGEHWLGKTPRKLSPFNPMGEK